MPRQKRVDEAGGVYHALNRGNARRTIFHKGEDFEAFLRVLGDGLQKYPVDLFSLHAMPNHWHFVLRPREDTHFLVVCRYVERNGLRAGLVTKAEQWEYGSLWRWLQKPPAKPIMLTPSPLGRFVDRQTG